MTTAIVHSGSAQRTDQPSWSTSRQVRVSRSPEPADSTTPTGSARVLLDEVLAQLGQHLLAERLARRSARSGSAPSARTRNPASTSMIRSTWPTRGAAPRRPATRSPSSRGAASAASAAQDVQRQRGPRAVRGCRRAMRERRSARTARPSATGSGGAHRATSIGRLRQLGLAGHDGAVRRVACRAGRGGVPAATTRPSAQERDLVDGVEHQRAGGGHHGGPAGPVARAAGRRSGPRCGRPRREVGSTSTSTSGSAASARASTSRCRWPPENDRPRSATIVVEAARAARRGCRRPTAVSQGAGSSVAACRATSSRSPSRPGEQRARRCRRPRSGGVPRRGAARVSGYAAEADVVVERRPRSRPSRSASAADSSGWSETIAVSRPGATRSPVRASYSVGADGRRRRRGRRVGEVGRRARAPGRPGGRRPGRGSACWRTRWRCAAGSSGTPRSRRTRPARRR